MKTSIEKMAKETVIDDKASSEDQGLGTVTTVSIDPAREAAVRRKFDIYVVPVSVIYLVLSTLDRNNVSSRDTSRHLYINTRAARQRARLRF